MRRPQQFAPEFIRKSKTRRCGRPQKLRSKPTGRIPDLSVRLMNAKVEEGDVVFLCAEDARPTQVKQLARHVAAVLAKTGAKKVGIVAANFNFSARRYWAGGVGVLEIEAEGGPKTRVVILKDARLGVKVFNKSKRKVAA